MMVKYFMESQSCTNFGKLRVISYSTCHTLSCVTVDSLLDNVRHLGANGKSGGWWTLPRQLLGITAIHHNKVGLVQDVST